MCIIWYHISIAICGVRHMWPFAELLWNSVHESDLTNITVNRIPHSVGREGAAVDVSSSSTLAPLDKLFEHKPLRRMSEPFGMIFTLRTVLGIPLWHYHLFQRFLEMMASQETWKR